MNPPFENKYEGSQEAAGILLLRVALALLGEARLRRDFGEEEALAERAAILAAEFNGGAPSPDPERPPVEASLLRPDRISLSAPFREGGSAVESLSLDGILFDGGTMGSITFKQVEPRELSSEERADLERRQVEWQAEQERRQRFTATRFVRSVAAPSQPGATVPVLAVELFEDGFYVDYTYDTEPSTFDLEMTAEQFFAREKDPPVKVEDDLGTEYFESGGGGGGGVRVSHSSRGFAPAPPPRRPHPPNHRRRCNRQARPVAISRPSAELSRTSCCPSQRLSRVRPTIQMSDFRFVARGGGSAGPHGAQAQRAGN